MNHNLSSFLLIACIFFISSVFSGFLIYDLSLNMGVKEPNIKKIVFLGISVLINLLFVLMGYRFLSALLKQYQTNSSIISEMRLASDRLAYEVVQRTNIEQELKKIKSFFYSILDYMPSVLIAIDEKCVVTEWNQEAEKYFDISKAHAKGKLLFELSTDIDSELLKKVIQKKHIESISKFPKQKNNKINYYNIVIYPLFNQYYSGLVIRMDD
ncbi:MAG: PAS domain-containing protein, partial [Gammaproteobacteria bacterium]